MDIGSLLTIASAWVAVGFWSGAISSLWAGRVAIGRRAYGSGLIVFLFHVVCAMHFGHGWSHSRAYEFTADQSEAFTGFRAGWGLYFNYLFGAVWVIDFCRWRRIGDAAYAAERSLVKSTMRVFTLFMVINGAIVFVGGGRRWLGVALLLPLALSAARGPRTRHNRSTAS